MPEPSEGELLIRVQAITIGAGQRAGLQGSASYAAAPTAGVVMAGTGAGVVEVSTVPGVDAGDAVVGPTGWCRHAVLRADQARLVRPDVDAAVHLRTAASCVAAPYRPTTRRRRVRAHAASRDCW